MLHSLFSHKTRTQNRTPVRVQQMTAQELQRRLAEEDTLTVVDVRTPGEYQMEHIAGSRLLPLSALGARVSELPQDQPIVCVCRSGSRSQVACEQLARQGFSKVVNLSGGMIAWKMAGLPVAK